jgi:hypothetical protein
MSRYSHRSGEANGSPSSISICCWGLPSTGAGAGRCSYNCRGRTLSRWCSTRSPASRTATIAYEAAYPEGWKISVAGETSSFPGLTVSNAGSSEVVVYSKNDISALGLLDLLLPYNAIPQKSLYL